MVLENSHTRPTGLWFIGNLEGVGVLKANFPVTGIFKWMGELFKIRNFARRGMDIFWNSALELQMFYLIIGNYYMATIVRAL